MTVSRLRAAKLFDCGVQRARRARILIDVHDADRARIAATEREVGDVHAMAAEDGADFADHSRLIVVGDDQHRAAERGFDLDAAHRYQTGAVRLEDGAFHPPFPGVGPEFDREQARKVA